MSVFLWTSRQKGHKEKKQTKLFVTFLRPWAKARPVEPNKKKNQYFFFLFLFFFLYIAIYKLVHMFIYLFILLKLKKEKKKKKNEKEHTCTDNQDSGGRILRRSCRSFGGIGFSLYGSPETPEQRHSRTSMRRRRRRRQRGRRRRRRN